MLSVSIVEHIYSRNWQRKPVEYNRIRGPISLKDSLLNFKKHGKTGIISEFKRKSPSGFNLGKDIGPLEYFRKADLQSVAGLSILTEQDHFLGNYADITVVQELNLPILDKDFVSSELMVRNAFNSGADAVLFILDFLGIEKARELSNYAISLGMEALVEFHDMAFLEALKPQKGIIYGYNRRNLKTLKMEAQEFQVLQKYKETEVGLVLESGIDSMYLLENDVSQYLGMLIGTSILNGEFHTGSFLH